MLHRCNYGSELVIRRINTGDTRGLLEVAANHNLQLPGSPGGIAQSYAKDDTLRAPSSQHQTASDDARVDRRR